jgi:hypothetical protein
MFSIKNYFPYFIGFLFITALLASCSNYKKLITDEIVLNDGNSQTGTIIKCDSASLKLKKIDESTSVIYWKNIDTIQGKKLKTLWFGFNVGYYNTPYFSVFRNEAITAKQFGTQYKIGLAMRGTKLYYLHLTYSPAKPYSVTKFGIGYQRYLGNSTYLKRTTFFIGSEFNLMNVKYNNGAQTTLEPFTGFEKKMNEHLRLQAKLGFQINLANKNNQTGVNLTIGIHFMKRNFKKHYNTLNNQHQLDRN